MPFSLFLKSYHPFSAENELESRRLPVIDMGAYKKIFMEHFETYDVDQSDPTFIQSQKSFETFYYHVLGSHLNSKREQEVGKFLRYFKQRNEAEQVVLVDKTSKILDALADLISTDPTMLENLDFSRVNSSVSTTYTPRRLLEALRTSESNSISVRRFYRNAELPLLMTKQRLSKELSAR